MTLGCRAHHPVARCDRCFILPHGAAALNKGFITSRDGLTSKNTRCFGRTVGWTGKKIAVPGQQGFGLGENHAFSGKTGVGRVNSNAVLGLPVGMAGGIAATRQGSIHSQNEPPNHHRHHQRLCGASGHFSHP
jgi:hypothetical protein